MVAAQTADRAGLVPTLLTPQDTSLLTPSSSPSQGAPEPQPGGPGPRAAIPKVTT